MAAPEQAVAQPDSATGIGAPARTLAAAIVPDAVEVELDNALRNNEEGRTATVTGVYRRS